MFFTQATLIMLNLLSRRNIINQNQLLKSTVSSLQLSKQLQRLPNPSSNFSTTTTTKPPTPSSCKFETFPLSQTKTRSLLKLQGPDTLQFLQGLITNDITHLDTRPAIYALFLNHQGRVLWDTILFSVKDKEGGSVVFIECDSLIKQDLVKHLRTYKLRKKVEVLDVEEVDEPVDLWVVFDHGHTTIAAEESLKKEECCGPTTITSTVTKRPSLPINIQTPLIHSFNDPRLTELGWRVLVPRTKSSTFPPPDVIIQSDEASYKRLRYVLGVAEGVKELPVGAALPLESNADYLHGVSFHKGCYVGQELTARTHHTGVVRKRVMPVRLPENNTSNLDSIDPSTLNLVGGGPSNARSLGKLRGICGTAGLGLIRIEQALAAGSELKIQTHNCKVEVVKPFWWPKEAAKGNKLSKA